MKNNIVLIGFMGCGKTSVGIRLSYRVRKTFLDTDKMIENKEGCSINEIFAEKGEATFRIMETECIMELLENQYEHVISVGGGLPVKEENRELLRQLGHVVYLKANAETIYERLKNDTTRPLLQGNDPKGKIEELLGKREMIYESIAHQIIVVDGKEFNQVLDEITE